jgi:hypothetical protein
MTKGKLRRLAMAIVAASALSGLTSPALAFEMDATMALQNVALMVQDNNAAGAAALIEQLRGLGITGISVGGEEMTLEDLLALIVAAEGDPTVIAQLVALVNEAVAEGSVFLAGDLVIASVETEDFATDIGLFPTGSVG